MLGKIEGKKRRGQQRMKWLDGIMDPMDMSLSKLWEIVEDRGAWWASVHMVTRVRHQLVTKQQVEGTIPVSILWLVKSSIYTPVFIIIVIN